MADKTIIAKRIKEFGHKKFGTLAELARNMELSPQTLTVYTEGKSFPGGKILSKLRELGCDINWLLSDEASLQKITFRKVDDLGIIPNFEYDISSLVPKLKNGELNEEWYYKEVVNFDPKTHVFLLVNEKNGYAMSPLILPGDMVLLDLKSKPEDGDLVAATWDKSIGEIRIYFTDESDKKKVVLISFNQLHKPIIKNKTMIKMYKVVMIKKGM